MDVKAYTKKVQEQIEEPKMELSYQVLLEGEESLQPLLESYQHAHLERCLIIEKLLAEEINSRKTLS